MTASTPAGDNDATAVPAVRGNTLTQDAVWTLAGNLAYAATLWATLVVISRSFPPELAPAMVGKYVLAIAVVSPIVLFTGLQLQTVLATDARRRHRFADYLGLRIWTSVAAVAVVGAVVAGVDAYRATWVTVVVLLVAKLAESTCDLGYGLFQREHRLDLVGKSRALRGAAGVAALAGALALSGSLEWGLVAMAVVWIAFLLAYDFRTVRRFEPLGVRFDFTGQFQLLVHGFPLGLTMAMISLNTQIPRYVVERHDPVNGLALLGYYSAMAYFNQGAGQIGQAVCQAASPRMAVYFIGDVSRYVRMVAMLVVVMLVASMGYFGVVLIAGERILVAFYGAEFAKYADLFWIVALAGVADLFTSVTGFAITAARYFFIQPVLKATTVAVCVVAVYTLTSAYGLTGAAWGLVITSAYSFVVGAVVLVVIVVRARSRQPSEPRP